MIPEWVAPYIGLPYLDKGRDRAGADCWGGVRLVLREVFGVELPDYRDAYTHAGDRQSVALAVAQGLTDGWHRRGMDETPRGGDLLILRIAGRPWHCGLIVGPGWFLHWPPPSRDGRQLLSCLERLDASQWSNRIEGIYRHG